MKAELMIEKKSTRSAASHSDQSATQGTANKVGRIQTDLQKNKIAQKTQEDEANL